MQFNDINKDNIDIFCMKYYDNPQCTSIKDYEDDMKTFKYIKRLLNQYEETKKLKEKLLLKHIIIVYNIFCAEAATRILFYKIDEKYYPVLKTFLIFLNYMPKKIKGIRGVDIISSDILLDENAVTLLRKV